MRCGFGLAFKVNSRVNIGEKTAYFLISVIKTNNLFHTREPTMS